MWAQNLKSAEMTAFPYAKLICGRLRWQYMAIILKKWSLPSPVAALERRTDNATSQRGLNGLRNVPAVPRSVFTCRVQTLWSSAVRAFGLAQTAAPVNGKSGPRAVLLLIDDCSSCMTIQSEKTFCNAAANSYSAGDADGVGRHFLLAKTSTTRRNADFLRRCYLSSPNRSYLYGPHQINAVWCGEFYQRYTLMNSEAWQHI